MHWPWSELGIDPTREIRAIRKAYSRRLKAIDPETDPRAFQALHEAYEQARADAEHLDAVPSPPMEAAGPAATTEPSPVAPDAPGGSDMREALDIPAPVEPDGTSPEPTPPETPGREESAAFPPAPLSPAVMAKVVVEEAGEVLVREGEREAAITLQQALHAPEYQQLAYREALEVELLETLAAFDDPPRALLHLGIEHFNWGRVGGAVDRYPHLSERLDTLPSQGACAEWLEQQCDDIGRRASAARLLRRPSPPGRLFLAATRPGMLQRTRDLLLELDEGFPNWREAVNGVAVTWWRWVARLPEPGPLWLALAWLLSGLLVYGVGGLVLPPVGEMSGLAFIAWQVPALWVGMYLTVRLARGIALVRPYVIHWRNARHEIAAASAGLSAKQLATWIDADGKPFSSESHPDFRSYYVEGRLNRLQFIRSVIRASVLAWVGLAVAGLLAQQSGVAWGAVAYLGETLRHTVVVGYWVLLWSAACRRLHDSNRSGWYCLFLLLPIVGPLFLAVVLLFIPGTRGDNRFGPQPRSHVNTRGLLALGLVLLAVGAVIMGLMGLVATANAGAVAY